MKASKHSWKSESQFGEIGKLMNYSSRKAAKAQRVFLVSSFAPLRLCGTNLFLLLIILISFTASHAQSKPKSGSHSTRPGPTMPAETKELLDQAIGVVSLKRNSIRRAVSPSTTCKRVLRSRFKVRKHAKAPSVRKDCCRSQRIS